jgi:hypothetical protein
MKRGLFTPWCARQASPILLAMGLVAMGGAWAQDKKPYSATGTFVEGCSCNAPCPCELTGVAHGCQGVGAMQLTSGSYDGVDLSGAKIAYATMPGDWVRLYIDAPSDRQRQAAEAFGRGVYSAFGKIEAVKPAKIEISGSGGRYTVSVDGGQIMKYTTEPALGLDGRTPIRISNIKDPLHPNVMLGKTVTATYQDGERSFTLKDSNSYSTDRMRSSGRL